MGIKISVAGKGGVGKTTLAGTLACLFAKDKKYNVLAIDTDPALNLFSALGISKEEFEKIEPISEQSKLIEETSRFHFRFKLISYCLLEQNVGCQNKKYAVVSPSIFMICGRNFD